jgi:hypothetical protein
MKEACVCLTINKTETQRRSEIGLSSPLQCRSLLETFEYRAAVSTCSYFATGPLTCACKDWPTSAPVDNKKYPLASTQSCYCSRQCSKLAAYRRGPQCSFMVHLSPSKQISKFRPRPLPPSYFSIHDLLIVRSAFNTMHSELPEDSLPPRGNKSIVLPSFASFRFLPFLSAKCVLLFGDSHDSSVGVATG